MRLHVGADRYGAALEYMAYVEKAQKNADLWRGNHQTATIDESDLRRASSLAIRWHLLVLSEDWCGDAVSTIPVLARLVEQAPNLDMRIVVRDTHPDLMDAHLSSGARSIPVVMALDDQFDEYGWWGPRPSALQRWRLGDGVLLPKEDRQRRSRAWYARDRGRTTIREVLEMLERAERSVREVEREGPGGVGARAAGGP